MSLLSLVRLACLRSPKARQWPSYTYNMSVALLVGEAPSIGGMFESHLRESKRRSWLDRDTERNLDNWIRQLSSLLALSLTLSMRKRDRDASIGWFFSWHRTIIISLHTKWVSSWFYHQVSSTLTIASLRSCTDFYSSSRGALLCVSRYLLCSPSLCVCLFINSSSNYARERERDRERKRGRSNQATTLSMVRSKSRDRASSSFARASKLAGLPTFDVQRSVLNVRRSTFEPKSSPNLEIMNSPQSSLIKSLLLKALLI